MKTSADPHRRLPTTNLELTPQEGETLRVSGPRFGPKERCPEYSRKELQEARTKLGGPIYGRLQRGQRVIHTGWPRQEDARHAMEVFSFKLVLCMKFKYTQ